MPRGASSARRDTRVRVERTFDAMAEGPAVLAASRGNVGDELSTGARNGRDQIGISETRLMRSP